MIYNNIQDRLSKLYASINQQYAYKEDALNHMHEEVSKNRITITFNAPEDKPKIENQINSVIANLAYIKDCLKRILEKRGDDPQLIENEINKSQTLQIVIDLANQEKHGYPLTKVRRSKKDPQIKNVTRTLMTSNKPDNILVKRSDGAAIKNMMTVINADINDSEGNLLCKLDQLLDNALKDWEKIVKKNNFT